MVVPITAKVSLCVKRPLLRKAFVLWIVISLIGWQQPCVN